MAAKERRRCFFDVTIDGELAGRVVMELYDDITPITAENFLQLCTGQSGTGKTTGKHLSYKGSLFHRVVKNFMIQGGDFTAGNGTGGESVYGGTFDDENFRVKHDQPFILSMANRGPNTNGSQFFITTNKAPHLNDVHVAFGRVVSGQEVVAKIEQLKTGPKNRPISDVIISNCGQMVKVAVDGEEESKTTEKKKKHKKHKRSKSSDKDSDANKSDEEAERIKIESVSSVKPEDLPQVPETNKFLLRDSRNNDDGKRNERSRIRSSRHSSRRSRSPRRDRSGIKVKGRGRLLYRSPSRDGSRTPPHWKSEQSRLISMDEMKKIQQDRIEKAAEELVEEAETVEEISKRRAPKFVKSTQQLDEHADKNPAEGAVEPKEVERPLTPRDDDEAREKPKERRHREIVYDVEDEPQLAHKARESRNEYTSRQKSESKNRSSSRKDDLTTERRRTFSDDHSNSNESKREENKRQRRIDENQEKSGKTTEELEKRKPVRNQKTDEIRQVDAIDNKHVGEQKYEGRTRESERRVVEKPKEDGQHENGSVSRQHAELEKSNEDRRHRGTAEEDEREKDKRSRGSNRERPREENNRRPGDSPKERRSHRDERRRELKDHEPSVQEDKKNEREAKRPQPVAHDESLRKKEREENPQSLDDERNREERNPRREEERARKSSKQEPTHDQKLEEGHQRAHDKSESAPTKENAEREHRRSRREKSIERSRDLALKHRERVHSPPVKSKSESRRRSPEAQKKAFTTMSANAEVNFLANIIPTPASAPVVCPEVEMTILPVIGDKEKDNHGAKRQHDIAGTENSPPKPKQRRVSSERRSSPNRHREGFPDRRGDRRPERSRRSPPRRSPPRRSPPRRSPQYRRRSPSPRRYDRRHRSPDRRRSPLRRRSPEERRRDRRRSRSTSSSSSSSGSSTSSSTPSSRSSSSS